MIPQEKSPCEWEVNWRTNPIKSYINTVKSVITRPVSYFAEIKPFEDLVSLAAFIYISSFIGLFFSVVFQGVFVGFSAINITLIPLALCCVFFLPLLAVGFGFLIGGILHLFFNWVGGSEKNFETTMTVYGLGMATRIFAILPFIGGLIALVYTLIINIGGQAKAHQIGTGRAALAALTPMMICCCLIFGSVFLLSLVLGGFGVLLEHMRSFMH